MDFDFVNTTLPNYTFQHNFDAKCEALPEILNRHLGTDENDRATRQLIHFIESTIILQWFPVLLNKLKINKNEIIDRSRVEEMKSLLDINNPTIEKYASSTTMFIMVGKTLTEPFTQLIESFVSRNGRREVSYAVRHITSLVIVNCLVGEYKELVRKYNTQQEDDSTMISESFDPMATNIVFNERERDKRLSAILTEINAVMTDVERSGKANHNDSEYVRSLIVDAADAITECRAFVENLAKEESIDYDTFDGVTLYERKDGRLFQALKVKISGPGSAPKITIVYRNNKSEIIDGNLAYQMKDYYSKEISRMTYQWALAFMLTRFGKNRGKDLVAKEKKSL